VSGATRLVFGACTSWEDDNATQMPSKTIHINTGLWVEVIVVKF